MKTDLEAKTALALGSRAGQSVVAMTTTNTFTTTVPPPHYY